MKTQKTLLLLSALTTTLALPVYADSVRVVLTPKAQNLSIADTTQRSTQSKAGCAKTPAGEPAWCINKAAIGPGVSVKSAQHIKARATTALELDSYGYSDKQVIEALSSHYTDYYIELDVPVTEAGFPTDPDIDGHADYFGSPANSPLGMNVYESWENYDAFSSTRNPLSLVIMDSSFFSNPEVDYAQGASFVTLDDGNGGIQLPSDNYAPRPESVEGGLCTGHGLGVSAAAAAEGNNGLAGAGVTNNVNLYPFRVMDCGSGLLSDTARAMDYLAGEVIEGVTPFSGTPGVINLSLGARLTSSNDDGTYCPRFMQESVDRVVAAGWTVVAAAGNNGHGDEQFTPANCKGVVTVGAYSSNGSRASFSNYGTHIDFVAEGEWVMAPCNEDDPSPCFWEGTSFASPLIAGVIAFVREQTGLSNEQAIATLAFTANRDQLEANCEVDSCGNGVPDLAEAMRVAEMVSGNTTSTMTYALNGKTECEQTWIATHFGNVARVCETVNVSLFEGESADGYVFTLLAKEYGAAWNNATVIGEFDTPQFTLSDSELTADEYAVKICRNDECLETVFDIDTTGIQEKPVACE